MSGCKGHFKAETGSSGKEYLARVEIIFLKIAEKAIRPFASEQCVRACVCVCVCAWEKETERIKSAPPGLLHRKLVRPPCRNGLENLQLGWVESTVSGLGGWGERDPSEDGSGLL